MTGHSRVLRDTPMNNVGEIDGVDGYFLTTKAWSLSLGRKLRIVMYYGNDNGGKESRRHTPKIFFCTDPDTTGPRIARFYRLRFQIEFEIRDAKQFTGLGHLPATCRSRHLTLPG